MPVLLQFQKEPNSENPTQHSSPNLGSIFNNSNSAAAEPNQTSIMNYVPKISQVILKSRVSTPLGPEEALQTVSYEPLRSQLSSWKKGSAFTLDVQLGCWVLERWSLYFEPSGKNELRINEMGEISDGEKVEFVILIQSLYAYIREMPVTDLLQQGEVNRSQLTFQMSITNPLTHDQVFEHFKGIQTRTFNPAEMSFGTFTLAVKFLCAPDVTGLLSPSPTIQLPATEQPPSSLVNRDGEPIDTQNNEAEFEKKFSSLGLFDKILQNERETVPLQSNLTDLETETDYENENQNQNPNIPLQNQTFKRLAKPISIDTRNRQLTFGSPIPSPKSHQSMLNAINHKYLKEKPIQSSSFANLEDGSGLKKSNPIEIDRSNRFKADIFDQIEDDEGSDSARSEEFRPSPRPSASWSRRESFGHELFGSLLGSYEESILNGRMSTTPSKPIEFMAEIGVFGKGKCKSTLKCPPHATYDFMAYFYQLKEHDVPTPYVGTIDLKNVNSIIDPNDGNNLAGSTLSDENQVKTQAHSVKRGSYRIPYKGLLQVIIKNPNKTVVKIFLIPYDVAAMPANTKTFIRQKCYSVEESNVMKYAIHLKMICNEKKKCYLHETVRVVFSHRVPDGSEKLKTVTCQSEEFTPLNDSNLVQFDEDDP